MFCHKCGTQLEDGQTFCHKCGTKMVYDDPQPAEPPVPVKEALDPEKAEALLDLAVVIEDIIRRKCPVCGAMNKEGAKFCPECGARMRLDRPIPEEKSHAAAEPAVPNVQIDQPQNGYTPANQSQNGYALATRSQNSYPQVNQAQNSHPAANQSVSGSGTPVTGIICPYCGSDSSEVFVKNYKEVYDKSFGCSDACCGYVIFGPLGLLCGLCGRQHSETERNETWHKCNNCGKQFRDRKEAKDKFEGMAFLIAVASVVLSFILSAQLWSHTLNIVSLFLAAGLLGGWIALAIGAAVFEEYPVRSMFTEKGIKTFLIIGLGASLLALIFGGIFFR